MFVRVCLIILVVNTHTRTTRLVGAYLAGVFLSDVLAYKSNSAGFKRGKVRRLFVFIFPHTSFAIDEVEGTGIREGKSRSEPCLCDCREPPPPLPFERPFF